MGINDDPLDALSVIYKRKSVRKYLDGPVSREELNILLKAGMAAPTATNKQPWAFVVVTDKNKLVELSKGLQNGRFLKNAGAAIVVCGVLDKAMQGIEAEFWVQDCSVASENILLAAETRKLGAVWVGVYPIPERIKFVREVIGIPENIIPLNAISIGYPTGIEKTKNKFDDANVYWNMWGKQKTD